VRIFSWPSIKCRAGILERLVEGRILGYLTLRLFSTKLLEEPLARQWVDWALQSAAEIVLLGAVVDLLDFKDPRPMAVLVRSLE
jgi:hypothetical protein